MKLIDKAALVAWALEELKLAEKFYKETKSDVYFGKINLLKKQLSFLDTLGVKEVDFEQELYKAFGQIKDFTLGMRIAKYFFELGLKAQHSSIGIPNIDDIFEEEGIDPNSKDAKIFKESYYMALEKLKAQKEGGV